VNHDWVVVTATAEEAGALHRC